MLIIIITTVIIIMLIIIIIDLLGRKRKSKISKGIAQYMY